MRTRKSELLARRLVASTNGRKGCHTYQATEIMFVIYFRRSREIKNEVGPTFPCIYARKTVLICGNCGDYTVLDANGKILVKGSCHCDLQTCLEMNIPHEDAYKNISNVAVIYPKDLTTRINGNKIQDFSVRTLVTINKANDFIIGQVVKGTAYNTTTGKIYSYSTCDAFTKQLFPAESKREVIQVDNNIDELHTRMQRECRQDILDFLHSKGHIRAHSNKHTSTSGEDTNTLSWNYRNSARYTFPRFINDVECDPAAHNIITKSNVARDAVNPVLEYVGFSLYSSTKAIRHLGPLISNSLLIRFKDFLNLLKDTNNRQKIIKAFAQYNTNFSSRHYPTIDSLASAPLILFYKLFLRFRSINYNNPKYHKSMAQLETEFCNILSKINHENIDLFSDTIYSFYNIRANLKDIVKDLKAIRFNLRGNMKEMHDKAVSALRLLRTKMYEFEYGEDVESLNDSIAGVDFVIAHSTKDLLYLTDHMHICVGVMYNDKVASGRSTIISCWKAGRPIACIELAGYSDAVTQINYCSIVQCKATSNKRVTSEIEDIIAQWVNTHGLYIRTMDLSYKSATTLQEYPSIGNVEARVVYPNLASVSGTDNVIPAAEYAF